MPLRAISFLPRPKAPARRAPQGSAFCKSGRSRMVAGSCLPVRPSDCRPEGAATCKFPMLKLEAGTKVTKNTRTFPGGIANEGRSLRWYSRHGRLGEQGPRRNLDAFTEFRGSQRRVPGLDACEPSRDTPFSLCRR